MQWICNISQSELCSIVVWWYVACLPHAAIQRDTRNFLLCHTTLPLICPIHAVPFYFLTVKEVSLSFVSLTSISNTCLNHLSSCIPCLCPYHSIVILLILWNSFLNPALLCLLFHTLHCNSIFNFFLTSTCILFLDKSQSLAVHVSQSRFTTGNKIFFWRVIISPQPLINLNLAHCDVGSHFPSLSWSFQYLTFLLSTLLTTNIWTIPPFLIPLFQSLMNWSHFYIEIFPESKTSH